MFVPGFVGCRQEEITDGLFIDAPHELQTLANGQLHQFLLRPSHMASIVLKSGVCGLGDLPLYTSQQAGKSRRRGKAVTQGTEYNSRCV